MFDYVTQGQLLGSSRTFKQEFENPIVRVSWLYDISSIHPFIHLFSQLSIHPSIRPSVIPFRHSSMHSLTFLLSLIHALLICSFIQSVIYSPVLSFFHPFTFLSNSFHFSKPIPHSIQALYSYFTLFYYVPFFRLENEMPVLMKSA